MTMEKESPARGEANKMIGSLVTYNHSKNPTQMQRFYWCRKSHSIEPFTISRGEVVS